MKKTWEEPRILVQQFMPNEYVAACGDTEYGNYLFECNAPAGTLYYYPQSDGKIDGHYYGWGSAEKMGSYTPCGATHEAPTTGDFYDGFVDRNRNGLQDSDEGVIVWRNLEWWGLGYRWNGHATTNLDMESWTKDRS